jgi:hypothetical protein
MRRSSPKRIEGCAPQRTGAFTEDTMTTNATTNAQISWTHRSQRNLRFSADMPTMYPGSTAMEFFASQNLGDDQHRRNIEVIVTVHTPLRVMTKIGTMVMRIDGARRVDPTGTTFEFDGFLMPPNERGVKVRGTAQLVTKRMYDIVILQERKCSSEHKPHEDCTKPHWVHPQDRFCPKCGSSMTLLKDPTINTSTV